MAPNFAPVINDRSAWSGSSLADDRSWVYEFRADELAEIDAALKHVTEKRIPMFEIRREDFPLPRLAPVLAKQLAELHHGRGFFVLRGFPVRQYSDEQAAIIYWGLGTHFGPAVRQNITGDLLDHVRDLGKKWGELGVRGYQTNGQLLFHTDLSDMVGLLCLRQSKSGGQSRIASSITIHNEILKAHPEFLPPLYRGYRYIRREAVESDNPVTAPVPVFGYADGYLSCRVIPERISAAYKRIGETLSPLEQGALDCVAATARATCLDMQLLPGDMQFVNNYTVLHSRTAYEDGDTPDQKRHLVRLWLTKGGARRPMAPNFPQSNGYGVPGQPPPVGAYELGLSGA
jgi:hypothetical protein